MKQQKILLIVLIALVVAVIAIQLFVKQKVKLGGMEGESSVFLRQSTSPNLEVLTDNTIIE